ncbi:MAG: hypothetical protein KF757_00045 [Phycisphaeraceae bacterium]|nr:hypothetical protein [Phycisphaeraceae bacterium]
MSRSYLFVIILMVVAGLFPMAYGDWRAELRTAMQPQVTLTSVMNARETLYDGHIGDLSVVISWDGEFVWLEIEEEIVTDVVQWWDSEDPEVLSFCAFSGKGTYGPEEDAGLIGWLYLNDYGELWMELEADDTYVQFKLPSSSGPQLVASVCRCRTIPLAAHGCLALNCDNTDECPLKAGSFCEWTQSNITNFEAALISVMVQ